MTEQDAPQIIDLQIDAMAFGGKGIGRSEGKVYFVEDAVEGDRVRATIVHASARYSDAKALEILTKSSLRQPSPCRFSNECGGCQWIDVDYQAQLRWKQGFVASALKRIGKVGDDLPIIIRPSPTMLGYRNRVHLKAQFGADGSLQVGYFRCRAAAD